MKTLIKNGRIIDPSSNVDFVGDLLAADGVISEISKHIDCEADEIIDAAGCVVAPGFIDLHMHLRDPGFPHKETTLTAQRAAINGGFTTICAMPNTKPVTDSPEVVRYIIDESKKAGIANVLTIGSITKGQKGEELSLIREMAKEGICGISEDGKTVASAELFEQSMTIAKELDLPVFSHCEDERLLKGGVINEGVKSKEYNLPGISNEVEDIIIDRDIKISEKTGARLHLCHVSTKGGVDLIRAAKKKDLNVTAEVCPHHFILTDDDILENDGKYKMNPPLRTKADIDALIEGLIDNTIDCIATDHAPHHVDEKAGGFAKAAFGIVGLETAFALSYTYLCKPGHITLSELIEKLTKNPAKVLKIPRGTLSVGSAFDAVILKTDAEVIVDVNKFETLGKNTPFDGYKLFGCIERVFYSPL